MKQTSTITSSIPKLSLTIVSEKGGASPGAIMKAPNNEEYMVKLGVPQSAEKLKVSNGEDLIKKMSIKSCEEKMFFNIAEAIGNNNYQLPNTFLALLRPSDYDKSPNNQESNSRNIYNTLTTKIKPSNNVFTKTHTEMILDEANQLEAVHFLSSMIDNYRDIGEFYNYHEHNFTKETSRKQPNLPPEPKGLGAFFALNCCMGNNDCIGSIGGNAGFNQITNQIIIVDGGNANFDSHHMVSHVFPTTDSNKSWLIFEEDLSPEAQKEACETFLKFSSLNINQLRNLITDNERTTILLGEEYITKRLFQLQERQNKILETFHNDIEKLTHKTLSKRAIETREPLAELDQNIMHRAYTNKDKEHNSFQNNGEKNASSKTIKKGKPNLHIFITEPHTTTTIKQDNSFIENTTKMHKKKPNLTISTIDSPTTHDSHINSKNQKPTLSSLIENDLELSKKLEKVKNLQISTTNTFKVENTLSKKKKFIYNGNK